MRLHLRGPATSNITPYSQKNLQQPVGAAPQLMEEKHTENDGY